VLSPFITALVFLINTVFGIYILLLMLRFLFQWMRLPFRSHPILPVLFRLTNLPLQFLYNFIPSWQNIDIAAIVLMLLLKMLELALVHIWLYGQSMSPIGLVLLSIANLLSLIIYIFIFAIAIQAILTWVARDNYNPLSDLLFHLNEPLLRPVRRLIPPLQGIDFSPLVAIIALQLADILVIGMLRQFI